MLSVVSFARLRDLGTAHPVEIVRHYDLALHEAQPSRDRCAQRRDFPLPGLVADADTYSTPTHRATKPSPVVPNAPSFLSFVVAAPRAL